MNDSQTFSIQFLIRHRNKLSPMAGIYMRITVNSQRTEISTKLSCPAELWNGKKEEIQSGLGFASKRTNQLLEQMRGHILSIYQDLRVRRELITVQVIKNHFLGNDEQGHTLQSLIDYHYNAQKNSLDPLTLKHYHASYRYLQLFLEARKKCSDIYLRQIDYRFLTDYESFLRAYQPKENGQRPLQHNTVMRHMSRFRTLINLAIKLGWLSQYPFKAYKISYKQSKRGYLTQEELEKIQNQTFTIHRLQLTRDLFLFSCYTGLAYIDISLLEPHHIVKGIDGENWIHTQRKKTDNPVRVPLLPIAKEMVEKYRKHPKSVQQGKLFPVFSNQKLNGYLKEIADLAGLDKHLTFHMARHTIATTITLSNGVPIETVSKVLGHNRIATTQIYAKVIERKVSSDMLELKHKLTDNNTLRIQNQILNYK